MVGGMGRAALYLKVSPNGLWPAARSRPVAGFMGCRPVPPTPGFTRKKKCNCRMMIVMIRMRPVMITIVLASSALPMVSNVTLEMNIRTRKR